MRYLIEQLVHHQVALTTSEGRGKLYTGSRVPIAKTFASATAPRTVERESPFSREHRDATFSFQDMRSGQRMDNALQNPGSYNFAFSRAGRTRVSEMRFPAQGFGRSVHTIE